MDRIVRFFLHRYIANSCESYIITAFRKLYILVAGGFKIRRDPEHNVCSRYVQVFRAPVCCHLVTGKSGVAGLGGDTDAMSRAEFGATP